MQRDKQIGLALGVLLIGVVGAFFFRNDIRETAETPPLENAESLDSEIAEKDIGPYLTGVETDEPDQSEETTDNRQKTRRPQARASADTQRTADDDSSRSPRWKPPEVGPGGSHEVSATPVRKSADGPPAPIAAEPEKENSSPGTPTPVPIPFAEEPARSTQSGSNSRPGASQDEKTQGDGTRLYEVRKGDTLSGLAARFLGSSARFMEIYKLNRDRLDAPDQLKAGMTIRIPAAGTTDRGQTSRSSSSSPNATRSSTSSSGSVSARPVSSRASSAAAKDEPGTASEDAGESDPSKSEGKKSRKFVPIRRNPFRPGPIDGQSNRWEPLDDVVRRLTQKSPEEIAAETADQPAANRQTTEASEPEPGETTGKLENETGAKKIYTVQRGDSLERIARRIYGSRTAANRIYKANRERLDDPDTLPEGTELVLPETDQGSDD